MLKRSLSIVFLLLAAFTVHADSGALAALKSIPVEAAKRLVAIEAREGSPSPERWYLLVNDPAEPRGLREFVVADGRLVTSRVFSQFADTLKDEKVVGADAVKVDSTHLVKVAAAFATVNGVKAAVLNYTLRRDAFSGIAVWRTTVLDAQGDQLGTFTVNATKGTLAGSEGFEKTPPAEEIAPPASAAASERAASKKPKTTPTPRPGVLKPFISGGDRKRNP